MKVPQEVIETAGLFSDETSRKLFVEDYRLLSLLRGHKKYPRGLRGLIYRYIIWFYGISGTQCWKEGQREYKKRLPALPVLEIDDAAMLRSTYVCTYILEQYAYKDKVQITENDVMLDCGGCWGDTAIWAAGKAKNVKVYSFEPNDENIVIFEKNLKRNRIEGIEIIPCGVGSAAKRLKFSKGGSGSCVCETGDNVIDIISIDAFSKEKNITPTFIKMDIEGSELDALYGATETIQKHKPKLAICLYHEYGRDMLKIVQFIKGLRPDYNFYLKKSHPANETVMFAV